MPPIALEPSAMPSYDLTVPHSLGREEAVSRVQGFSEKLKERMGDQVSDLEQSWEGGTLSFSFKTFGFKISGALDVKDDRIDISGDLPFAAAMFKGKIVSGFEEQLTKILRG
ncbi:MAG: polyhydroxyalkanoic acid system family protein [Planctomycetota bacterium]